MVRFALGAWLLALFVSEAPAMARQVEITEWAVPWENTRPRDPFVDTQHRVWFVGQRGDYVGMLDPETGQFEQHTLPDGTGPHNLILDDAGTVWFTGNAAGYVGALDRETGEVTKYPMPDARARDPHTLLFDEAGDLWFTVQGGNFVGKLTKSSGEVHLLEVPTGHARPYGIVRDGGTIWVAEFGTNKLVRIDASSMALEEIALPREAARPRRLVLTSNGDVWYVDYAGGYLGRYQPGTGEVKEWSLPDGDASRPYGMAVDDQDRLWMVETGVDPNRFVGFDTATEAFVGSTPIESGGGAVRNMFYHAPAGEVWFGTDANTIGRAKIADPEQ